MFVRENTKRATDVKRSVSGTYATLESTLPPSPEFRITLYITESRNTLSCTSCDALRMLITSQSYVGLLIFYRT